MEITRIIFEMMQVLMFATILFVFFLIRMCNRDIEQKFFIEKKKILDYLMLPLAESVTTAKQFESLYGSDLERIYFISFSKIAQDPLKQKIIKLPEKERYCAIAELLGGTPLDEWNWDKDNVKREPVLLVDVSENKDFSQKTAVIFSKREFAKVKRHLKKEIKSEGSIREGQ